MDTLYDYRWRKKGGQVKFDLWWRWAKRIALLGLCFFGLGMMGIGWILIPWVEAELNYYFRPAMIESKIKIIEPEDTSFYIYISKINANSLVIENVDPADQEKYLKALKKGVAQVAGLGHPGQLGTTYLFAHSTDSPINFARYNAVFFLLDKLEKDDLIEINYHGKLYKYVVSYTEILAAQDLKYFQPQDREELLVLQTCHPPGTTWKRLVVVATPLDSQK